MQKAYYDGTVHVQTALAGKFPWNTWNHVSVKLTGDSVQPALNGVSLGTFTNCQYDTAYDEIGLTAHTGGRNYYDWILIRKAVQNEPAHGSWGSGEVNPVPPTASFTADPQSGQTPLAVQFTDQSSMAPTTWQWDFGDGTPNSTLQNPTHTYSGTGKKTVTLTVSNTYGTSTLQKTDYITVLPPPPFLDGWSYRKLHTISGSPSGVLTDYPIRFKVYNTTGTDTGENVYLGSHVNPDFSDLRFTTPDNTLLNYWVQETGSNYAVVWVKVPSIPTTGTQMYLYHGNPSAPSLSNGDATFIFYDDFTTLNPTDLER